MDPITTAIIASVTAGITGGFAKSSEKAITDSYEALKNVLKKKFGKNSEVVEAVKRLEEKPESEGRMQMLQEEVVDAKADKDPDVLELADALLKLTESQLGGQFIQQATGNYIAQAGPEGTASVQLNRQGKN